MLLLAFSSWVFADSKTLAQISELGNYELSLYGPANIILIVVSCVVIVTIAFGCYAANHESNCGLTIYGCVLIIAFSGVFTAVIIAVDKNGADGDLEHAMLNTLILYDDDSDEPRRMQIVDAWDGLQGQYGCCGVDSYQDWSIYNPNYIRTEFKVPPVCCSMIAEFQTSFEIEDCRRNPDYVSNTHEEMDGCVEDALKDLNRHQNNILAFSISELVFLTINFVLTFVACFVE